MDEDLNDLKVKYFFLRFADGLHFISSNQN
jgi:hypothetical protein